MAYLCYLCYKVYCYHESQKVCLKQMLNKFMYFTIHSIDALLICVSSKFFGCD